MSKIEFEKMFSEGFIKDVEEIYIKGNGNEAIVVLDYGKELLELKLGFRILPKEESEEINGR